MSVLPVQDQTFTLIGNGAASGATSIVLQSFKDILGVNQAMVSFGTIGYGTIEPNTTNEDSITFTGITQNSDGTATLTGVNSVLFISPFTPYSGLRTSHAGSVPFIITNTSAFTATYANKNNAETINQNWSVPDPVGNTDIANKEYVLSVVNGGTVTTSNVVVPGTAGATIASGNFVYLNSDGTWYPTNATTSATVNNVQLGIAQGAGSAGLAITGGVLIKGLDTKQTGLVAGTTYYLSNTPGAIGTSAGTFSKVVGQGKTATTFYFDPEYTYIPTAAQYTNIVQLPSLVGTILPYGGRTAPTGYLLCDGAAVSRSVNAALFAVIAPAQVFTVTIASPAVFSATAHGLVAGDKISLSTTGGLPSGLATNTDYYVIATGLTSGAFEVALSPGGAAVNTTGSQSGVHTLYASAFGKGDGATTFNVPNLGSRMPLGLSATAPTETLAFEPAAVSTGGDTVTIINTVFPSQGQAVVLTTTGTLPSGLSLATTYYIIRLSSTTIQFATSQANANAGTQIDITSQGSGVHTMTYTNLTFPVMGQVGGEESHALATTELASHTHSGAVSGSSSNGVAGTAGTSPQFNQQTGATGGNGLHNNISPFITVRYIIKT